MHSKSVNNADLITFFSTTFLFCHVSRLADFWNDFLFPEISQTTDCRRIITTKQVRIYLQTNVKPMIEIRCFGQFEVKRDGVVLSDLADWKGRTRNIKLLKILLTPPGKHFTTGELVDCLWPDEKRTQINTENRARQVRAAVAELRKILEPSLENPTDSQFIKSPPERQGYFFQCQSPNCVIDTLKFAEHCRNANELMAKGAWEEAEQQLKAAVELCRGQFFEEDRYEEWTFDYRDELAEAASNAYVMLAECFARKGSYLKAIDSCQKAIQLNSSRREELEQKISLYRSSRQDNVKIAPSVTETAPDDTTSKPLGTKKMSRAGVYWTAGFLGILVLGGILIIAINRGPYGTKPAPISLEHPAIQFIYNDIDGFNFAGGFPPLMVDFEELDPNTDITSQTINGVRFEKRSPSSAVLTVTSSEQTFTTNGFRCEPLNDPVNLKLLPSSGGKVLSPGGPELAPGPNPALEDDDLVMVFERPVKAVGFDILWQAIGGSVSISLESAQGTVLYQKDVSLSLGTVGEPAPSGNLFVGFVAEESIISKVTVNESDDDSCHQDSNIGYDSIRYRTTDHVRLEPKENYVFERQWGSKGNNAGQFNDDSGPRGLAIVNSDQTYIYVSDYVFGRIQLFSVDGRVLNIFPFDAASQDIEYDGKGSFYVRGVGGFMERGGVAKLDMDMNVIWSVDAPAAGWAEYGLCIDSDGNIHVPTAPTTKPATSRMRKYDPNGKLLHEYGQGMISGADRCESSPEGFLYVTDGSSTNLRKFNNSGELLDTIELGFGISGIAISKDGNQIFLATHKQAADKTLIPVIKKYDKDFGLLAEWGGSGTGNGFFSNSPEDLELDSDGKIYAVDGKNYLIQVFHPSNP